MWTFYLIKKKLNNLLITHLVRLSLTVPMTNHFLSTARPQNPLLHELNSVFFFSSESSLYFALFLSVKKLTNVEITSSMTLLYIEDINQQQTKFNWWRILRLLQVMVVKARPDGLFTVSSWCYVMVEVRKSKRSQLHRHAQITTYIAYFWIFVHVLLFDWEQYQLW